MDLRIKKTKNNIHNAFLQLRAKKPLERISVKELCEIAEISKATFYLHYKDIYDLSETLQQNVIKDILGYLSDPEDILSDPMKANNEIFTGSYANGTFINTLFGDSRFSKLPEFFEREIKNTLFRKHPEFRVIISWKDIRRMIRKTKQSQAVFQCFLDIFFFCPCRMVTAEGMRMIIACHSDSPSSLVLAQAVKKVLPPCSVRY